MRFWVFAVVDARIGGSVLKASDILRVRVKRLYWLLNPRSIHFKKIGSGDRVVFYIGGRYGKKFAGRCILASNPIKLPPEIKRFVTEDVEDKFDYAVNLREADLFHEPKPIEPIVKGLSFIKVKDGWWRYLQGGVIPISQDDFTTIVNV